MPVMTQVPQATALPMAKPAQIQVQSIGQPVMAAQPMRSPQPLPDTTPKKESEDRPGWRITEKDIQREIGRYTEGFVDVQMTSDTKAVVYIDDKDVPAAIGKGGKNISAIVNKIGIGIDIKPRSEFDRQQAQPKAEEELNIGGGIKIQTDKKQLTIVAPEQSGKIVDVFAGQGIPLHGHRERERGDPSRQELEHSAGNDPPLPEQRDHQTEAGITRTLFWTVKILERI